MFYHPNGFSDSENIIIHNNVPYFYYNGNTYKDKLKNGLSLEYVFQQQIINNTNNKDIFNKKNKNENLNVCKLKCNLFDCEYDNIEQYLYNKSKNLSRNKTNKKNNVNDEYTKNLIVIQKLKQLQKQHRKQNKLKLKQNAYKNKLLINQQNELNINIFINSLSVEPLINNLSDKSYDTSTDIHFDRDCICQYNNTFVCNCLCYDCYFHNYHDYGRYYV